MVKFLLFMAITVIVQPLAWFGIEGLIWIESHGKVFTEEGRRFTHIVFALLILGLTWKVVHAND